MGYTPEYARGQILVGFVGDVGKDFACDFGDRFKCKLSEERSKYSGVFLYDVPEGEEQNIMNVFLGYREFVDWASLRDEKLESRWDGLEGVARCVRDLGEDVELPDTEYNMKLDEIIEKVGELKV